MTAIRVASGVHAGHPCVLFVMTQPGGLGYTDTDCSPKFGKNQSLCIKCQQKLLQVLITLPASRRDFTTN